MAESTKLTEDTRLWGILKRSIDARKPFTRTNEIARLGYHGSPDIYDLNIPSAFWNSYRTLCLNIAGVLISGEPRPSVRPQVGKDELSPCSVWLNGELSKVLSRSSFRSVMTNFVLDVPRYGGGYMYLGDDNIIKHCSWFDCYADNALGRGYDPYRTSRYFFVRQLWDKSRFEKRFNLKIDTFNEADSSDDDSLDGVLPGRQVAGVDSYQRRARMSEESTKLIPAHGLLTLPGASDGGEAKTDIDRDGLVEWWLAFEYHWERKGWKIISLYKGKIIGEPQDVSDDEEFPPIFTMQYDDDGEQFYSPGAYVHEEKNQYYINFLLHRFARQLETITDPPVISPLNNGLGDGDAARLIDSGKEIRPSDANSAPFYPNLPDAPAWWFNLIDLLFKVANDSSGQTDILSGQKPDANTSGVTVSKLAELGQTRRKSLPVKRDEVLRDLGRRICVRIVQAAYKDATAKLQIENQGISEQNQAIQESNRLRSEVGSSDLEMPLSASELTDFLPEELKIYEDKPMQDGSTTKVMTGVVTVEMVKRDLMFDFAITPPITREDQYSALMTAIGIIHPIIATMFPLNPMFAVISSVRIAALATSTQDISDEVEAELMQKYAQAGQAMEAEESEMADRDEEAMSSEFRKNKVNQSKPEPAAYDPSERRGY